MLKQILKLIRKTNKKTFRRNSDHRNYPYVCAYNMISDGYVYKNGKRHPKFKRWDIGPEKYGIHIYDKGLQIDITHLSIKIYKTISTPHNLFPDEHLMFEGENLDNDDHFNLSMSIPNIPTASEINIIRSIMNKKERRYTKIYIYLSKDWM